ncbi:MAG: cell division protein FtsQ [Sphingobacteriaceae bacterium]|nr:cell division protein FtsQ [Sphingobacteriaceae bacterium]
MLNKINWHKVFYGFAWVVSLSGLVILMSFIEVKKQEQKCEKIQVIIPGAQNFVEREEIDLILKRGCGVLIGENLSEINTEHIEKQIKTNPYINFVKVYIDMDGVLNIKIKQRQPILRVINAANQDYYIDRDGFKMPTSANFTADVLVASGNIFEYFSGGKEVLSTKMAKDLFKMAALIEADALWNAQIQQIFVTPTNDILLVPTVGKQRIIFGNADSIEVKFKNLGGFYKNVIPKYGWEMYKTVNLKYINQIVCEKNKADSNFVDIQIDKETDTTTKVEKIEVVEKILENEAVKKAKFAEVKKEVQKPKPSPLKQEKKELKKEKSTDNELKKLTKSTKNN